MADRPPLTDEELLAVADDPEVQPLLNSEERRRLSRLKPSGLLSRAGTVLKTAASDLNPLTMIGSVVDAGRNPELGGAFEPGRAATNILKGMTLAQWEQLKQAADLIKQGRYVEGAGRGVAGLLPVVGPLAAGIGEDIAEGRTDEAVGHLGALVAPAGAAKVLKGARMPALARNPNPAEAAAVQFGQRAGIPVDAGTATGNYAVRGAQALADRTVGGSLVATGAKQQQGEAFARVGTQIADRVHPTAVTGEQAGEGVRGAVTKLVGDQHAQATGAYDRLRQIEADPAYSQTVNTATEGTPAYQRILTRLKSGMPESLKGQMPTTEDLTRMRQIAVELESQPFVKRTWNEAPRKSGNAAGGDWDITPGAAGASVYDDILQAAPGTSNMTRGEVLASIKKTLETGEWNNASAGAFAVARGRMGRSGGPNISGQPILGTSERVNLPVDLVAVKQALKPIYDRMMRQLPITQARSSPGLKAIENIVNGPDFAPVSQVDMDLGQIKGIARGADLPELRDLSQGLAAQAIKQLDEAVQTAVAKAGPEASDLLTEGRNATRGKYQAADVLRELREEPVQAFNQTTWAHDAGIDRLRRVVEMAPGEISKVGRAYLDGLLETATAEGGFGKAQGIAAKWQALGPKTKDILFGNEVARDLDSFFLLAKKAAENPNPSGTGFITSIGAQGVILVTNPAAGVAVQVAGATLAKLLRAPKVVRALTQGFTLSGRTPAGAAAANAIFTEARRLGIPLAAQNQAGTAGQEGSR